MANKDLQNFLIIKGARENNLKNISLTIPKNKLVVFTGLSGSGKSSLAFNTIYEEGRRRYVDSLSSYARMFLGGTSKPDVDSIEGLSPAISIEQKTVHNNPRSTVGTVTEIYDYLRLLFARIGKPFCPKHNIEISSQTTKDIIDSIYKYKENTMLIFSAPLVEGEKGTHQNLLTKLKQEGFLRVKIDGVIYKLNDDIELDKNARHSIDLVINRIALSEENYERIAQSVDICLEKAGGHIKVENVETKEVKIFSKNHSCIYKDFEVPKIETKLFSFNSPYGMCENCKGIGVEFKPDFNAIIVNDNYTIEQGAIDIFKNTVNTKNLEWQEFEVLLKKYNIPIDKPINTLTDEQIEIIKYGSKEEITFSLRSSSGNISNYSRYIDGVLTKVEKSYYDTSSERIRD
ncbi:excinuclease ABC subunit A domain protein [Mycoplasmopsis alligatoris A21JP2]|uniref:UvrABC system protein A n=1 Tax=Mycoplasmopsis alligatoris A21JP2 TaxID=747682 RepID=D4XVF6_9BACT|nr:excinuclease ABC subunit A domain protein [Mycoplasmopsis alligatoris A21JP2]